jgi:hypothetical protein
MVKQKRDHSIEYIPIARAVNDDSLVFYTHANNADRLTDPHLRVVAVDNSSVCEVSLGYMNSISVQIDVEFLPEGVDRVRVQHQSITGMTTKMLSEFFRLIEETAVWVWFDGTPESKSSEWRKELVGRMMKEDSIE